jgi:hypothetical protein
VTSLISSLEAWALLAGSPEKLKVQLHTGNPGGAGTNNIATENTRKEGTFPNAGGAVRQKKNSGLIEWSEVKAKETYTFFSVWGDVGPEKEKFLGYAELNAPVAVEAGDSVKFNKEALVLEIP